MARTYRASRRYHLTHAQLAAGVRAADERMTQRSRALANLLLAGTAFATGYAVAAVLAPAHGMPLDGPELAQDGFPWFSAILATLIAAFALWRALSAFSDDDEGDGDLFDHEQAESRGGRDV